VFEETSRALLRHLPGVEHHLAGDHHVFNALRIAKRLIVRGQVAHGGRVENGDVRRHSRAQQPSIVQPKSLSRLRGHLSHCFLDGKQVKISRVVAQHPRR